MKERKLFHVRKRTLLCIAGCVWLLAGFNVARLGIISYGRLEGISYYGIYDGRWNMAALIRACAGGFYRSILYRTWVCSGAGRGAFLGYVL